MIRLQILSGCYERVTLGLLFYCVLGFITKDLTNISLVVSFSTIYYTDMLYIILDSMV